LLAFDCEEIKGLLTYLLTYLLTTGHILSTSCNCKTSSVDSFSSSVPSSWHFARTRHV